MARCLMLLSLCLLAQLVSVYVILIYIPLFNNLDSRRLGHRVRYSLLSGPVKKGVQPTVRLAAITICFSFDTSP
jgi:hypothetical protein